MQQRKMTISDDNILKRLWQAWLKFGHWLGNVMSWVWMPLFYFVVLMPFALVIKLFADPLQIRRRQSKSHWNPKRLPCLDMQWARNQGSIPTEESAFKK